MVQQNPTKPVFWATPPQGTVRSGATNLQHQRRPDTETQWLSEVLEPSV